MSPHGDASDPYGLIVAGPLLEVAVVEHLRAWLPAYRVEVVRQFNEQTGASVPDTALKPIRSFVSAAAFDKLPEDQMPCIVLESPGLTDKPEVRGDGQVDMTFGLVIGVVSPGKDADDTRLTNRLYGAAIAAIMVQQRVQHPNVSTVTLTDLAYDAIPFDEHRTIAATRATFDVVMPNVLNRRAGPLEPPADPLASHPAPFIAETVDVTLGPYPSS